MGVDTKAIIRKGVTLTEIVEKLKERYVDAKIINTASSNSYYIVININCNRNRTIYVSYAGYCLSDYGIDGVYLSLGHDSEAIEIMKYICESFGGYLDENDCDDECFYPINFDLYQKGTEFTDRDLFVNKVISKLGYDKVNVALELFEEYKNLNN